MADTEPHTTIIYHTKVKDFYQSPDGWLIILEKPPNIGPCYSGTMIGHNALVRVDITEPIQ